MANSGATHLAQPIGLGHLELQHRLLMGSMHTGLEEERGGMAKLAAFYVERIRGGVELVITGGISPNLRGRLAWNSSQLSSRLQLRRHRHLTSAVHAAGGYICMQILHAGRYAMHPLAVAPSAIRAPISPITPSALSARAVRSSINDFVQCALLAQQAGYDGVEIMGSEGYLINQFLCARSNQREDDWGGSFAKRMRFPLEIVRGIRQQAGQDFVIIFRLSMLDLVEDGSSWEEVVELASAIEQAGASAINTGIGWHEVRIPTIAAMVPRAAFSWVTRKLREHVSLPLISSNRFNAAAEINQALADGSIDMVSMARPFLADPQLVDKLLAAQDDRINTCIACNQGCLDRVFNKQRATCLVNPFACYETELKLEPAAQPKRIAVIGLGPAGLAFALTAARRGHRVTAWDRDDIGGQFNLACRIPGKEEFSETLRYYRQALAAAGVEMHLGTTVSAETLAEIDADLFVLATGVVPRVPDIEGIDHSSVLSYVDYIRGTHNTGERVAIIGAGGIGFDVASRLVYESSEQTDWYRQWGVDVDYQRRGGVMPAADIKLNREITLMQRKPGKPGAGLGKTTGWIHRLSLRQAGVHMLSGVRYHGIDDRGLHIEINGMRRLQEVDTIICCAGQLSRQDLLPALEQTGKPVHVIGGARLALELDAERAIREATELALQVE